MSFLHCAKVSSGHTYTALYDMKKPVARWEKCHQQVKDERQSKLDEDNYVENM